MRLLRIALFVGLVGLLSGSAEAAATYTWGGTGTNVLDPLNWSGGPPGAADDAVFDATGSTSPDVTAAWSVLNLRFSSSPAYTFGGAGIITIPVGGSIDTGAATGNITFNNAGLSFTRAAGINATGAANITVAATTPFKMGIGTTNADPYLNAVGGDITINSLVDFTSANARRNLICAPNAGRTITLAGGVSPTTTINRLGNVYVRGEAGGKVILGSSTTWKGWTDIYDADLEINSNDSLGDAGQAGGAYYGGTQWIGTANNAGGSLLLTNNITCPEQMYITARSNGVSGIKNKSGHNTLSGVMGAGGPSIVPDPSATMYNFESVGTASGDLFEISGIIQPTTWNTGAYTVALRGAGPGLISGTISSTVLAVNTGTADGGTLGVTKFDGGTWTFTNANTYTGPTVIAAGILALANNATLSTTGSIANSSTIVVQAGAKFDVSAVSFSMTGTQTLKGNGEVVGNVTAPVNTTVAPGESIGTLTVSGNATLGGTLDAEFDGSSSAADLLAVSGALDVSSATLSLTNSAAPSPVGTYVLATYGSLAGTGTFATVVGMPAGYAIDYHYAGANSGNSIALVVPEPATWMLLGFGALGLMAYIRRKR